MPSMYGASTHAVSSNRGGKSEAVEQSTRMIKTEKHVPLYGPLQHSAFNSEKVMLCLILHESRLPAAERLILLIYSRSHGGGC